MIKYALLCIALISCSCGNGVIPVNVGFVTDNFEATYSSKGGLSLDLIVPESAK